MGWRILNQAMELSLEGVTCQIAWESPQNLRSYVGPSWEHFLKAVRKPEDVNF